GVVPVAVNTLLSSGDYEYMLADSRAQIALVSAALLPLFEPLRPQLPALKHILVSHGPAGPDALAPLIEAAPKHFPVAPTTCDEPCLWLYSSRSTGPPRGTPPAPPRRPPTAELYAPPHPAPQ